MKNKRGIDWSKKDLYEGIGRTDLKPRENILTDLDMIISENTMHGMYDADAMAKDLISYVEEKRK